MSRMFSRHLLGQSPLGAISESAPIYRLPTQCLRPFSNTCRSRSEGDDYSFPSPSKPAAPTPSPVSPSLHPKASTKTRINPMDNLLNTLFESNNQDRTARRDLRSNIDIGNTSSDGSRLSPMKQEVHTEPHHFHIYATRHNTHITVTKPNRAPIISKSCGDIGFKHSARKHYDSAFQLASYVMSRLQESGTNREIEKLEVVLRGFGAGREAVTKALLGSEGRFLRGKIIKVADATRLKFGGTRSKKPRRLG